MCRRGGAPRRRLPLTGVMPPKPSRLLPLPPPPARRACSRYSAHTVGPSAVSRPMDSRRYRHGHPCACTLPRPSCALLPNVSVAPQLAPSIRRRRAVVGSRLVHAFVGNTRALARHGARLYAIGHAKAAQARNPNRPLRVQSERALSATVGALVGGRMEFVGVLLQFGRRHPPRVEWALPHRRRRSQSPSALAQRKPWH